jgi:signal peptidase I
MIITGLALSVVSLVAIIDSWYLAKHTKPDYELKEYNRWYVYLLLWLISMGGSTTYSLYFRDNYMEAFRIPTASNYPTMAPGDRFLANKLAYRNKNPKRGDLVVFVNPQNRRVNFVKRVVAIAGDTVEIKGNDLCINGQKLERRKLDDSILSKIKTEVQGEMLKGDVYEETNNGAKYKIFLKFGVDPNSANFAKVTVPKYHCFVLGDNRNQSEDSRHFGPVPLAAIKARADYLYWPAKDWARFGRLGPDLVRSISAFGLFHYDCLDGTFISGLLNSVFVFGRNLINDDLCHILAHLEDFGAGITTKPTGGASISNTDFHNESPFCDY